MSDAHVFTHHKTGSTWLRRSLRQYCAGIGAAYSVLPATTGKMNEELKPGAPDVPKVWVYRGGSFAFYDRCGPDEPGLHLIRDPRDAFVSQFWSWRNSHANNPPQILEARRQLQDLSVEDGVAHFLDNHKFVLARQLEPWPDLAPGRIRILRYEDLLDDFRATWRDAIRHLGLPYDEALAERIHRDNSFEKLTRRKPGTEDVDQHLRKGIAGDWTNYLDGPLKERFKERYGDLTIRMGYESSHDW